MAQRGARRGRGTLTVQVYPACRRVSNQGRGTLPPMTRMTSAGLLSVIARAVLVGAVFFGIRAGLATPDALAYLRAGPCPSASQIAGCKLVLDATYDAADGYFSNRRTFIPTTYDVEAGDERLRLKLNSSSTVSHGHGKAEFWNGRVMTVYSSDGAVLTSDENPVARFRDSGILAAVLFVFSGFAFYLSYALRRPQNAGRLESELDG